MKPMHSITVPSVLVYFFETVLMNRQIAAGTTNHDNGDRTYKFDPAANGEEIIREAADEAMELFEELKQRIK
jgi:hypothetical protein